MKIKIPKQIPSRIKKLVEALDSMFDLSSWDVKIEILKEDSNNVTASIECEEDYQRLTIKLYPFFFRQSLRTQRADLVHEYCHSVTRKVVSLLDDFKEGKFVTPQQIRYQSERATSQMANLVDSLLDGQYLSKRKAYREYLKSPKKAGKKR